MSDWTAREDDMDRFFARDHLLPNVTPQTVRNALADFALPLLPERDFDWLAMAVRRSLAISLPNVSDGPERTSNADIRGELKRLAALAGSTWLELFQCEQAAESHLWDYAWHHWNGEGGTDVGDGLVMGEPSDFRRLRSAVAELDWLAGFMERAASATEVPRKQWKNPERKALRIQRGRDLAPSLKQLSGGEFQQTTGRAEKTRARPPSWSFTSGWLRWRSARTRRQTFPEY